MDALVEIELKEAFPRSGCALCRIGEDAVRRYLRFFLHEQVNDAASRLRLIAARGFCRRHAWHFVRFEARTLDDALSTAVVSEGLIESFRSLLAAAPAAAGARRMRRQNQRRLQGLTEALTPTAECPACDEQRRAEDYAGSVLLAILEDPAWRERVMQSDGVCLRHLGAVIAGAEVKAIDTVDWLVADYVRRFHALLGELTEYMRKHDYRFSDEPYGSEADAPVRAMALLAGSWFDLPAANDTRVRRDGRAPALRARGETTA
jgi:hypothetical protein